MQLSPVVRSMTESATLLMARRARELRAQGKDIIDLSLGEPDQDPPAFAIEAAKQAITCLLYTSRAHETVLDLVCRLLLEKNNHTNQKSIST